MRRYVLGLLVERLERVGIQLEVDQPTDEVEPGQTLPIRLRRGDARQEYVLVHLPAMTFTEGILAARENRGSPVLVVGEHVSERSANSLREAGVQYADATGNAYLSFGDVLVDIRGRRRKNTAPLPPRFERPANLFSPRRAQVAFALITWPELARGKVRELAAAAGVSVGLAHDGLELLQRSGYLDPDAPQDLRGRRQLLDHWTAAYPSGLAPALDLAVYSGDLDSVRPADGDQPLYISGESAVPRLIRPVSLTVYVDNLDPRLPVVNRWRSDAAPNIAVRKKFWSGPPGGGSQPSEGLAPWPLVYADLMATGEARQKEAAAVWRDEHAGL